MGDALQIPSLSTLDGRFKCIVRYRSVLATAVLCSSMLSPSKRYIFIGDFYSDQLGRGWYETDHVEIVEVLQKIAPFKPAPKPWWKRIFGG